MNETEIYTERVLIAFAELSPEPILFDTEGGQVLITKDEELDEIKDLEGPVYTIRPVLSGEKDKEEWTGRKGVAIAISAITRCPVPTINDGEAYSRLYKDAMRNALTPRFVHNNNRRDYTDEDVFMVYEESSQHGVKIVIWHIGPGGYSRRIRLYRVVTSTAKKAYGIESIRDNIFYPEDYEREPKVPGEKETDLIWHAHIGPVTDRRSTGGDKSAYLQNPAGGAVRVNGSYTR